MLNIKSVLLTLFLTTLSLSALAVETEAWQEPDCSQFATFKKCVNDVKSDYRRAKQKQMKEQGLSFWYYQRPSYKGEAVTQALKDKVSGAVTVEFDVNLDGTTSNVNLASASSTEVQVFAPNLITAIEQWTFVPPEQKVQKVKWQTVFFYENKECEPENASDDDAKNTEKDC